MSEHRLTAFERIEIQMRYVVPLLRGLQAELGEEAVLKALRAHLDKRVARAASKAVVPADLDGRHERMVTDFGAFAEGGILDYDVIASDASAVDVDVSSCGYQRLMAELDATDIGSLLLCGEDEVIAARGGVDLHRSGTRMTGASHCDFRFRPKSA